MDDDAFTLDADALTDDEVAHQSDAACHAMESIYEDGGHYPIVTVDRRWSSHNRSIAGELAHPAAYRWYLARELRRLIGRGASIRIEASRPRIGLDAPDYLERVDEQDLDITRKKLFLFAPERIEVSVERIEHSHGEFLSRPNPAGRRGQRLRCNQPQSVRLQTGFARVDVVSQRIIHIAKFLSGAFANERLRLIAFHEPLFAASPS